MSLRPDDTKRREQMRIGAEFLRIFPQHATMTETARKFQISRPMLEREEKLAAYKLVMRLRQLLRSATFER